jgi:hypothetical protein
MHENKIEAAADSGLEPPGGTPDRSSRSMEAKIDRSRRWLLTASLTATGANLLFFILAPALGYPLEFHQSLRMMQILLPVVLGYLGSMAAFLFQTPRHVRLHPRALPLLEPLVRGPLIIFGVASVSAIFAFGYTNRAAAEPGTGMSVDTLSGTITISLGILTVTTNAIVAYLFGALSHSPKEERQVP